MFLILVAVFHVLTQHFDNARTGANLDETQLTTSNITGGRFGKLFTRSVDGQVFAQPLYVAGLELPGAGTRNVLFVATMHNSVYAFDADDPAAAAPLWQTALEPSVPLPDANIGAACGTYKDISVEIGIIGTPAIDLDSKTIYLVTASSNGTAYAHHLHALDLTTGAERAGSPVALAASVAGTGDSAVDGTVTFQDRFQIQRPGLLVANGRVYLGFAGYCDTRPYHGWVLGYDATTLAPAGVFNSTPNGWGGGVWQSGQGLATDDTGRLYVASADGSFDRDTGGVDLGNGLVALNPDLTVNDWFALHDAVAESNADTGLGASGPMLMPVDNVLVCGAKSGKVYVVDRAHLGGFNPVDDSQIIQSFMESAGGQIHGSPVYWDDAGSSNIYLWAASDVLKRYHWNGATFDDMPQKGVLRSPSGVPGAILSLSANGATAGTGIVWANMPVSASANQAVVDGVLRAVDAESVATVLWSSELNPTADRLGKVAKFSAPVIVNGHVYVGTSSNTVVAYGLLPSTTALALAPDPSTFGTAVTVTATVSGPAGALATGSVTFYLDGVAAGSVALDAQSSATFSFAAPSVGVHSAGASYAGDHSTNPNLAAPVSFTVGQAVSTTTLMAQAPSGGDAALLTATVSGAVGVVPTGLVSFFDGDASLGEAVFLDATGTAQLITMPLAPGAHAFVARYAGDALFAASDSAVVDFSSPLNVPDAGPPPLPDAAPPDAVPRPDAVPASAQPGGCAVGGRQGAPPWLVLLLLVLPFARRRRPRGWSRVSP